MTIPQFFTPDSQNARALRAAFGAYVTGVCVVTAQSERGPMGMTINSFTSVSLDPPLVMWAPARSSARCAAFARASHFAIHVLRHDQIELCLRFAGQGAGFSGLAHDTTPDGTPVLADALARFDCEHHAQHDGGDHLMILGRVTGVETRPGDALVFSQGRYGRFQSGG